MRGATYAPRVHSPREATRGAIGYVNAHNVVLSTRSRVLRGTDLISGVIFQLEREEAAKCVSALPYDVAAFCVDRIIAMLRRRRVKEISCNLS